MNCTVHPRQMKRRPHRGRNDFNRMLNHFLNDTFNDVVTTATMQTKPAANVTETTDAFLIDLAIPGLSKKDIDINVEKDVLTISAKKEIATKEGETIKRTEFNYNEFKRAFRLSDKADLTNIKANFKNGVLTISIAKKEEAKDLPPRHIDIL